MLDRDEVPHPRRLTDDRRHDATSGTKDHQFDRIVVDELVENFHRKTRQTLQNHNVTQTDSAITTYNTIRLLANVNLSSCSLYVVVRPSVCRLSVCNVRAPYSGN